MRKALALITYSREHYLALVLPSILAQRIGDKLVSDVYDVYIFQDGLWAGETSENSEGHATVSTMLEAHPQQTRVFKKKTNLGVALHFDFIEKLLFVEKAYDFVAFCEDDMILAPGYMFALDQMRDRFADDPRIGMMSAHPADCTVPLESQREHRNDFAAMGHNWAFGLSRSFWERRQPFVEGYLDLIRDVPYRLRDEAKIFRWLELAGFRAAASSQDYIKCCATTALGACRLATFGNLGLPVGRTGLHCTPEIFSKLGMDRAVVIDGELLIGPLSDEQFSAVYRKSSFQRDVSVSRVVRFPEPMADQPHREVVDNNPSGRPGVQPDSIEAISPILGLVSSRLAIHSEWAVPLLELVADRLTVQMLRRTRDVSQDPSVAIRAAISMAGHERANVEDWIALSHLLASEGRLSEALNWVNRVLQHQSHVASHHRLKASVLERLDRFEEALTSAGCALELDSEHPDLIVDRERIVAGYVRSMQQLRDDGASKPDVAIDAGMKLAQRAQALPEDWTALTMLLAKAERLNEALAWSSRALDAEPWVAGHHRLNVSLLRRLMRLDDAMQAVSRGLALHPGDRALAAEHQRVESAYLRHLRQRRDGSPDLVTAIAAGQQLAQREPQIIENWLALAQLLVRDNRDAEALVWIEKAMLRKPRVAEYFIWCARVLERLGRYDEALQAATRASQIRPADHSCASERDRIQDAYLRWLRQTRDASHDLLKAIETAHMIVQYEAGSIEDWVALAQLFARAERLDEALTWATRALNAQPENAGHHCLVASLLQRLGRLEEALHAVGRGLERHPNDSALLGDLQRIGEAHRDSLRRIRDGSTERRLAIQAAEELGQCAESVVGDWLELAHLLRKSRRWNEALAWVERVVEAEPEVVSHLRLRASLLERLGRYKNGYQAAQKARRLDPSNSELARDAKRMFRKSIAKSLGLAGLMSGHSHE
jgi:tetratricopeptide (TPR) repeat protein